MASVTTLKNLFKKTQFTRIFSAKFKIDMAILTYINKQSELSFSDVRTDPNYRKSLLLKRYPIVKSSKVFFVVRLHT